MMRILIFSDSHGAGHILNDVLLLHSDIQTVVHLGDGAREAEDAADRFPERTFYCVRGNCDFAASAPEVRLEILGGKRILMTHGHRYGVKGGLYTYSCAAREQKADIALFGHTHQPLEEYDDGLYIFNPGSIKDGRYGILDVSPQGVMTRLMRR